MTVAWAFLACLALGAGRAGAQSVRGTVYRNDGATPAGGAVTLLIGATDETILARAVSSSRGLFLLRAPRAGAYRVRVLRLGQVPTTSAVITLADEAEFPLRMVLADRPLVLASRDVRAKDECRVRPDSGLLVAQLLTEARTALLSSTATSLDGERIAEYQRFVRLEDRRGRLVAPVETLTVNTLSARPFTSLAPEVLARVGYVAPDGDSVLYVGPDAEVLLSDAFAAGHCFQVVDGTGERASSIGVAFRPVAPRRGVVDIRGTLWMDRATTALQRVEYTYEPIPVDERRAGVGGEVHFARTDGGFWFVSHWQIRMPRVAVHRTAAVLGPRPIAARTVRMMEGLHRSGGEVVALFVNDVEVYRRAATAIALGGAVDVSADAATPAQLGVARDSLTAIAADSVDRVHHPMCGPIGSAADSGVVQGRVTSDGVRGVGGVTVVARWRDVRDVIGGSVVTYRDHQREATSATDGRYVLCGVPLGHPVSVFTTVQNKRSRMFDVRLLTEAPVSELALRTDVLTEEPAAERVVIARAAALLVRVAGADGAPIADALVTVTAAGVDHVARTDSAGAARLLGLAPGAVTLRVRRIGYAEGTVRGDVRRGDNEMAITVRGSTVTLKTVTVTAARDVPSRLADVDARIARGEPSAVVTRADIEKRNPIKLTQMLRGVAGLRLADSLGTLLPVSTRGAKLLREGLLVPCVMRVMIDGVVMPAYFEIDQMVPVDVHAVEVFFGAARVPPQFGGTRTDQWCGLIAVWTRAGG